MLRFFIKVFFKTKFKQLVIKTLFTPQPLNPFYEFNQNLAEVREMKKDNGQRKNNVHLESNNPQSDRIEV